MNNHHAVCPEQGRRAAEELAYRLPSSSSLPRAGAWRSGRAISMLYFGHGGPERILRAAPAMHFNRAAGDLDSPECQDALPPSYHTR